MTRLTRSHFLCRPTLSLNMCARWLMFQLVQPSARKDERHSRGQPDINCFASSVTTPSIYFLLPSSIILSRDELLSLLLFVLPSLSFRWTCPVVVPTSAVQIVYMYVPLVYAMAGQLYTCSSTSLVIVFAHLSRALFVIADQEKHTHNTDSSTAESKTHRPSDESSGYFEIDQHRTTVTSSPSRLDSDAHLHVLFGFFSLATLSFFCAKER